MADRIDVAYVAHLARMELTPEEASLFQNQLSQILTYADQLAELDVTGVEPTAHAVPIQNVFREDEAIPQCVEPEKLMANAPLSRQGQVLVPRILE